MNERKLRKTHVYALVGVLLISILAVTLYAYLFSTSSTPIPIDNDVITWPVSYLHTSNISHTVSSMNSFGSYDDLKKFLTVANESSTNVASSYPPTIIFADADETDTLRANGGYVYILFNETLYIINADPNAKVLAKIHYSDRLIVDYFISQDGSDLVIICDKYEENTNSTVQSAERQYKHEVFIGTYDVSKKTNPILTRNFTISGDFEKRNARIAGSYLYVVVTQQAEVLNGDLSVPLLFDGVVARSLKPNEIFYTNSSIEGNNFGYTYTTVAALNMNNYSEKPTVKSVLLGFASTIFSKENNMYFVSPVIDWRDLYSPGFMGTDLYRVSLDGASLTFVAQGTMAGMLFDHDSIDEHNGYLRLVTKLLDANTANLQIFDLGFNLKGTLERIAGTRNLYGLKLLGNRCYLHVDYQPDRFLVVDLSDPSHPTKGGELETGAVQTFLCQTDENHIVSLNGNGGFLFVDVSNANTPSAKSILGGSGGPQVYYDRAAFLFDSGKSLVAFPVRISRAVELGHKGYEGYWQGVLVWDVTSTGLTLRGNVSHITPYTNPEGEIIDLVPDTISRSICVGDLICTVSPKWMQLNRLDNMDIVANVPLS